MSLLIWLPLTKDARNLGLSLATVSGGDYSSTGGKLSGGCYKVYNGKSISIAHNIPDTTSFSYSFWIYIPSTITSVGAWLTFLQLPGKVNGSNVTAAVNWASYNLMKWYDGGFGLFLWLSFSYDTWVHVTTVHSSGNMKVYINGELGGREYTTSDSYTLRAGTINIGASLNATNGLIRIQDFRLYSHSLSPSEVKELSMRKVGHWLVGGNGFVGKNLVDGYFISGSISGGTVSVEDGIATVNNTSGSWCRLLCRNESTSNTNMENAGVANKTITVSFDVYMISGSVPGIFISDSYRNITGVDASKTGVWQRGWVTYTHPGKSSSYNYFTPHFNNVSNCKIRNLKVCIGSDLFPWSGYNLGNTAYDVSGLHNDLSINGSLGLTGDTKRYERAVVGTCTLKCNNINFPDGPCTLSFWSKPVNKATEDTSKMSITFNRNQYFTYINYPYFQHNGTNLYKYKYTNYWSDGNWHHVGCVYDGSTVKLYIDGQDCSPSTTNGSVGESANFVISLTLYALSDCRLYATALSAADILELYSLGN